MYLEEAPGTQPVSPPTTDAPAPEMAICRIPAPLDGVMVAVPLFESTVQAPGCVEVTAPRMLLLFVEILTMLFAAVPELKLIVLPASVENVPVPETASEPPATAPMIDPPETSFSTPVPLTIMLI